MSTGWKYFHPLNCHDAPCATTATTLSQSAERWRRVAGLSTISYSTSPPPRRGATRRRTVMDGGLFRPPWRMATSRGTNMLSWKNCFALTMVMGDVMAFGTTMMGFPTGLERDPPAPPAACPERALFGSLPGGGGAPLFPPEPDLPPFLAASSALRTSLYRSSTRPKSRLLSPDDPAAPHRRTDAESPTGISIAVMLSTMGRSASISFVRLRTSKPADDRHCLRRAASSRSSSSWGDRPGVSGRFSVPSFAPSPAAAPSSPSFGGAASSPPSASEIFFPGCVRFPTTVSRRSMSCSFVMGAFDFFLFSSPP
mmetsp:Transcript_60111/g.178223  ORF Transcript_60111/g.178223 Transcript_60111/m.178223 type:complete len:311 (+) Transcript_60111:549-1481(+)